MLYHVWFATKRRKWFLQGDLVDAAKSSIRGAAERHHLDLLVVEAVVDHVHLLLRTEPRSLSRSLNLLKGASARELFLQFPELKLDEETSAFWQARFGFKGVSDEGADAVRRYMETQWERLDEFDRPMPRPSGRGKTSYMT